MVLPPLPTFILACPCCCQSSAVASSARRRFSFTNPGKNLVPAAHGVQPSPVGDPTGGRRAPRLHFCTALRPTTTTKPCRSSCSRALAASCAVLQQVCVRGAAPCCAGGTAWPVQHRSEGSTRTPRAGHAPDTASNASSGTANAVSGVPGSMGEFGMTNAPTAAECGPCLPLPLSASTTL